jgi:hypothetical protein
VLTEIIVHMMRCSWTRWSLLAEILAKEVEDLSPTVHGLLRAVSRSIVVEEAVPRAVIAVEKVGLAVLAQGLFVLVYSAGLGDWSSLPNRPRRGALKLGV